MAAGPVHVDDDRMGHAKAQWSSLILRREIFVVSSERVFVIRISFLDRPATKPIDRRRHTGYRNTKRLWTRVLANRPLISASDGLSFLMDVATRLSTCSSLSSVTISATGFTQSAGFIRSASLLRFVAVQQPTVMCQSRSDGCEARLALISHHYVRTIRETVSGGERLYD